MKNKILSILCAIAMFATMANMFVVYADDAPTIKFELDSSSTTKEARINVSYSGVPEGKLIAGMQIEIPIDTTKYVFGSSVAKKQLGYDQDYNCSYTYSETDSVIKMALNFSSEDEFLTETSGTLGAFIVKLAEGAAAGQTYEVKANAEKTKFNFVKDSGAGIDPVYATTVGVTLSTGEKTAPAIPAEPEAPDTAYVYLKARTQPAKGGDEVTFDVTYANADGRSIAGMQIEIPVDTTKYSFVGSVAKKQLGYDQDYNCSYTYSEADKVIKMALNFSSEDEFLTETSGTLGAFTIKVADTAVVGDEIQLKVDEAKTKLNYVKTGGIDPVYIRGIASKLVVGAKDSGSEPAETTLTVEPTAKTAKAGEDVVFTVTTNADEYTATADKGEVAKDGNKVTVTVPATAAKDDVITVTFKAGDKEVTAKITVTADEPTPEETTLKVEPTEKTAKAGEDVVFTVTTNADEYTVAVDNSNVTKKASETYTYTVPTTASKGDVITVTFKAGDKEVTAKITVEATEKPVANLTPASVSVKDSTGAAQTGYSFSVDKTADKAKVDANIDDTKTYIILFDFNAAGFLATPITGAQIKALYDDDATNDWLPTVYASNKQQPSVSIVNSDFSKVSLAD